jgi:Sulfotransferase family
MSPVGDALFVNIPKNASTSFQRLLPPLGFRYTTAFRARQAPAGAVVFAVVREPVSRWISAMAEYDRSPDQRLPFADFAGEQLKRLRKGTYVPLDEHLTPQSTFLLPTMPVSWWLRFEHLDEDYAALAAAIGLPTTLRHHRRALVARSAVITDMITPQDTELVRAFYADDVRLYERVRAAHR